METYQDCGVIEVSGLKFAVRLAFDESMGAPWDEHCGHGVVSDWTTRDKGPGERVLNDDRGRRRFYDVQASMERARADGWGISTARRAELEAKKGRPLTRGEVVAEAVEADYQRLRGWCDDRWHWCGVVVTLLDVEGEDTDTDASLWGIESDSREYHAEVAHDLARELADGITGDTITQGAAVIRVRESATVGAAA